MNHLDVEYSIGVVAEIIGVHPETLRVWERNGLITLQRSGYQRRYSNNDLKRLKFIHNLVEKQGLNVAGVRYVLTMYSCWQKEHCPGGQTLELNPHVNIHRPCWKLDGTYCWITEDLNDYCDECSKCKSCSHALTCFGIKDFITLEANRD